MDNARLVALKALLKVQYDDGYSNIVLDNILNKSGLSKKDRSLTTAIFYGVLERRIELDYIISLYSKTKLKKLSKDNLEILRMGVYQIKYMDKIPNSAVINESVKLAKMRRQFKSTGFINAVLRSIDNNLNNIQIPKEKDDMLLHLSIKYSCPEWLIKHFVDSYNMQNTQKILQSLSGRPPLIIRVNTLKNTTDELIEILKFEGINASRTILENALEINSIDSMSNIKAFREGRFHVQDLASQICCDILNPKEGQTVIDVCAAPGGKTFNIAQRLQNKGTVFSFDLYESKVNLIKDGAKRLGIEIINAFVRDASSQKDVMPIADRVLCDVPCSGLGIIRRKPEIRYKNKEILDSLKSLQYLILCNSEKFTKENGILVYSTCTLNPLENTYVANKFLKEHNNYEPYEIKLPSGITRGIDEPKNQLTLLPGLNNTDGFFIAAFKKRKN